MGRSGFHLLPVYFAAFLFVGVVVGPLARPACAFFVSAMNMSEDAVSRQSKQFHEVRHGVTSFMIRQCLYWSGTQCKWPNGNPAWEYYPEYRLVVSYVQRLRTGWADGGLVWAQLDEVRANVLDDYPENEPQVGSDPKVYHYCPLDGSADGSNVVGWWVATDIVPVTAYVTIYYNIPTGFSNEVMRYDSGRHMRNDVYASSYPIAFGAAREWSWVDVCNVARHYNPGLPGAEVTVDIHDRSWDPWFDIWCFCWRSNYYNDDSRFTMNFN